MSGERVWLRHAGTGGYFNCPEGAVDEHLRLGWEPSGPPEEHNPVVAELLAAQPVDQAKAEKSSRKGGANTTSQES